MKKSKTYPELYQEINQLKSEIDFLNDILKMDKTMLYHATNKKVLQSFEIIELKEKMINYKLDILALAIAVIFISIIAIIK